VQSNNLTKPSEDIEWIGLDVALFRYTVYVTADPGLDRVGWEVINVIDNAQFAWATGSSVFPPSSPPLFIENY
jgi:hypothetical protein